MKKLLPLILVALIMTGCNGFPTGTIRQPEGKVIVDGQYYIMIQSNYEWKEDNVEIRQKGTHDISELAHDFVTLEVKKGDTLKFEIDKNPTSITVTKLNDDGTIDSVEIKDNKITMPSEGGYYIYELKTTWNEGKETFVFDVNVE